MVGELRDKVALVTGGAGGLGRATARALAEAGAVVVVADIDEDGGRAVAEEVDGRFTRVDVADLDANRAMVEWTVREAGGLDLALLNAGISSGTGVAEGFDLERYRRAMGVNLDGVVFGTHAALPALQARGGGCVVATASLAGLTPMALDPIYTANKHAVVGFTRAMAQALAADGIRFNALCPAFAESGITAPIRDDLEAAGFTIMPAERVADAAVELCASDRTGDCVVVQPGREPLSFRFRNVPGPRPAPPDAP
jgi:NAD(P)-dependent dehydrogenase (short-subunit alcohol dehydrogenase family)